ncbi:hypothetical protein GWK26_13900 [haloarchaeon 3A1-DGR]|nr:hypothetical protein GWK26_13900 [haloarchaeon 3A1-DGR]
MVSWECPIKPRKASGLDPEAVHLFGFLSPLVLFAMVLGGIDVPRTTRTPGTVGSSMPDPSDD